MGGTVDVLPVAPAGQTPTRVLTIAGSDSGGGAGIQADMRSFAGMGVHACVAVTAVTVQNSTGVYGTQEIDPSIVGGQIRAVVTDIGISAAKTGMLASKTIVDAVVTTCEELGIGRDEPIPLVVDPVCASMHGDPLLDDDALEDLCSKLIPRATVVTPNINEVALITGIKVIDKESQHAAAQILHDMGAQWALIKGGHLLSSDYSPDLLYNGDEFLEISQKRISTPHDHGAGDTLAAGLTAALAHGYSVPAALRFAKGWVTRCLNAAYPLGEGRGPVNALWCAINEFPEIK